MKKPISMLISFSILLSLLLVPIQVKAASTQIDILGPVGSGSFGSQVAALPSGNIVITDPGYDAPGPISNVGAVYLYNGSTQALISTLTGTTANDAIGNLGITVLKSGNYVISSSAWQNGAATAAGAVSFGNGNTGVSGVVSASNSLVGSATSDSVGNGAVIALPGGNYVVRSPNWDSGGTLNVGAATWGDGNTGVSGVVSASNSLVGSTTGDVAGTILTLSNGNYVVRSPNWGPTDFGAVTFGNAATGISGVVSASNSLVGSAANDLVGNNGVLLLTNGNYVVSSASLDNGAATNVGAATWGSGSTGISGPVSAANSLIGTDTNDSVGNGLVLNNGNYVLRSPNWGSTDVGAVTWGNGTTGITGTISSGNSLLGASANDFVGSVPVVGLANGNYVVSSPSVDLAGVVNVGAATWGNGLGGITGTVSAANSLVGTVSDDNISNGAITALANGNYVVRSSIWGASDVGAATFGNGTTGITGPVTSSNSLVGSAFGDSVGSTGITALSNGNYVVLSAMWDNGAFVNAGAATWGNGTTGISGNVSTSNSLIGAVSNDNVGIGGVTALTNGNYVVRSQNWDNGPALNAGAVTWGNGTTGIIGTVSAANSLVGTTSNDRVSTAVVALSNGNYVVQTVFWINSGAANSGALTWGNGTTGVSGNISAANSLIGSVANDFLSDNGVTALSNGNYIAFSTAYDNGGLVDAGAITYGNGTTGATIGSVAAGNSVIGTVLGVGGLLTFVFDYANNQMVVGRQSSNIVTLFRPLGPTAAEVSVSGRVLSANGRGLRNARVSITGEDGVTRYTTTSSFGYYSFVGVEAGETYVLAVASKLYRYSPRAVSVTDSVTDLDFAPDTTRSDLQSYMKQ